MNANGQCKVWIRERKTKKGTSYHLRWICPTERKWKNRYVATDFKLAQRQAYKLQDELDDGTYRATRKIGWDAFVADHVSKIPGKANATEAAIALRQLGEACHPSMPKDVSFSMVEAFVAYLRGKGNAPATINKKVGYVRNAMKKAIRRGYAAVNPIDSEWTWEPTEEPTIRTADRDQQTAIVKAADEMYGLQWRTFIQVLLATGGRCGELFALTWDRVFLDDDARVRFTKTKTHDAREVPIDDDTVDALRRLQVKTLRLPGPFAGMSDNYYRQWRRIRKSAGVRELTVHDLRRTAISEWVESGASPKVVQRLAGHRNLSTTMRYYVKADAADLRKAIERRRVACL